MQHIIVLPGPQQHINSPSQYPNHTFVKHAVLRTRTRASENPLLIVGEK